MPNPVADWLNLTVVNQEAMSLAATIFIASGRKLKSIQLELNAGTQQHPLNVNDLLPGLYILRLSAGSRMMMERFVKE